MSTLLFALALIVTCCPIVAALGFIAAADFSSALVSLLSAVPMALPAMMLVEASVEAEFKGR